MAHLRFTCSLISCFPALENGCIFPRLAPFARALYWLHVCTFSFFNFNQDNHQIASLYKQWAVNVDKQIHAVGNISMPR